MATEVGSAPMLQSVQKAMALPTVGAAVGQMGAFYTKVKGAHSLLEWALSTAEASVTYAAATAAPFVAAPLAAGDAKVAAAIDELERRVPLVTEQPKVIVETTKQAVLARITPQLNKAMETCIRYQEPVLEKISSYSQVLSTTTMTRDNDRLSLFPFEVYGARNVAEQRVKSLKELTWTKANALLSTAYGQKAMHGVDTGATYAMQLLNHYLPPTQEETNAVGAEIVAAESDPALHTVQTVGRLSAVAARRVWANLAARVNQLRDSGIELDVRRYITALLAALHLAKVTSEQQQIETKDPKPQTEAEPATTIHPSETHQSAPTTTEKVKSTPEAKSTSSEE